MSGAGSDHAAEQAAAADLQDAAGLLEEAYEQLADELAQLEG